MMDNVGGGASGMGRLLDFRISVNSCEGSIMKAMVFVCVSRELAGTCCFGKLRDEPSQANFRE
jgi:hypothetical protein